MRDWWSRVPRDGRVAAALAALVLLQTIALAAFGHAAARSQRAEAERDLRAVASLAVTRGLSEPAATALASLEAGFARAARSAVPDPGPDLEPGFVRASFLVGADGSVRDAAGRTVVAPGARGDGEKDAATAGRVDALEAIARRDGRPGDVARALWAAVEGEENPAVAVPGLILAARSACIGGEDALALAAVDRLLARWPHVRKADGYPPGAAAAAIAAEVRRRRLRDGAPDAAEAFVAAALQWREALLAADLPRAAAAAEAGAVRDMVAAAAPDLDAETRAALATSLDALDRADSDAVPLRDADLRHRLGAAAAAGGGWVGGPDTRGRPALWRADAAPGGNAVVHLVDADVHLRKAVLPLLPGSAPREGTEVRLLSADGRPLDGAGDAPRRAAVLAAVPVALPGARAVAEVALVDAGLLDREAARGRAVVVTAFALAAVALALGSLLVLRMVRAEVRLARMKADFVASVSHDLKTPLTSIRMFLETLREGRTRSEAERRECLEIVDREAQRLERMVERVLQFSRMAAGARPLVRETVDPASVVREAAAAFRRAGVNGSSDLRLEVASSLPVVRVDRDAVTEIVLNLLDNAWKYTPLAGRRIVLRARAGDGGGLRVEVEDNGPGVRPEDRERVFEEFFRGDDPATAAAGGTGLGLALVRNLARAHGGSARVADAPGGGSLFIVDIPADGGDAARAGGERN